jgi:hypothetical protein
MKYSTFRKTPTYIHDIPKRQNRTKPAGELIQENLRAHDFVKTDPMDMVQDKSYQDDWTKNLMETVEDGKQKWNGDFFVYIHFNTEPLLGDSIRCRFFHQKSAPMPTFSQALYRYTRKEEKLEYLWTVPCIKSCLAIKKDPVEWNMMMPDAVKHVLDFCDGTLDKKVHDYNLNIDLYT